MKIILAVVLLTVVYLFGMSKLDNIRRRDLSNLTSASVVSSITSKSTDASSSSTIDMVTVNISGAVLKPGTYKLEFYHSLAQLIELAGGVKENADSQCYDVNYIFDGTEETIYIPYIIEAEKISINRGDLEALDSLPDIGPTIAKRIVEYREINGFFKKLEDLKQVSGIGPTTFTKLKDLIKL